MFGIQQLHNTIDALKNSLHRLGEFNHKLSEELEKHDPVALRKIKEEYGPLRRKNKEDAK